MQDYVFMTDSDSDLPLHFQQEYQIPVVHMPYSVGGREYFDDLGHSLDYREYYRMMREGAQPITSALNKENYLEYFEPVLKEHDLLFLAFSSKLSSTIQEIYSAREELLARYPERKFIVVDTLSISAPMTILILKAHQMYSEGKSMEEVAEWVERNKLRAQAFFTVDDLVYLKRGGRLSAAAAAVGTMLDLKPVLVESREGKIVAFDKIRGRKKAISYIVDKAVENMLDETEAPGIVVHADAPEDAKKLQGMLQAKFPRMNIIIENVGPVIGAHAGPGIVAFSFMGKERPV